MSSALKFQGETLGFSGQTVSGSSYVDFCSSFAQPGHRRTAMYPSNAGEDWTSGNKSGVSDFRSEAPRSGSGPAARLRLVKIRKGPGSRGSRSSEIPNPFRSESENPGLGSTGSSSEPFVFGANRADSRPGLDKNVVKELKDLIIGGVTYKAETFVAVSKDKLNEDLRKLNIGEDPGNEKVRIGRSNSNNVGGSAARKEVDSELLNELNKKLSIKGGGDSSAGEFGGSLRDQIKSLKIEDSSITGEKENPESLASSTGFSEDTATGVLGSNLSQNIDDICVHTQFASDNGMQVTSEGVSQVDAKISGLGVSDFKVPKLDKHEARDEFVFISKQDYQRTPSFEFKTAATKTANLFSGVNEKVVFSATRDSIRDPGLRKKGGKLRGPTKVQLWLRQDFVARESSAQESTEASDSYSPMEVSPYRETLAENQCSRENSVTSDGSLSLDNDPSTTDSVPKASTVAVDEDLAMATERMDINYEVSETREEMKEENLDNNITGAEGTLDESVSGAETESFKSANGEVDFIETEVTSSSNVETHDSESRTNFVFATSSEDRGGSNFTFSASAEAQSQNFALKRLQKKKNQLKFGHEGNNSSPTAKVSYASSSSQFIPFSGASLLASPGKGQKGDPSSLLCKTTDSYDATKAQAVNLGSGPTSASTVAAQEACEKWRLRGNQAYTNGDLSKAEDCYTQGINSISKGETSRSCLRALMLCYSNRAATRISLGRMRDALEDCKMGSEIDTNFLRVQVRAANCYLALGEVEDAALLFRRCLQAGSDICVDRKIAVEASDGLQKVQKLSECMTCSSELLLRKTSNDVESALDIIAEALTLSQYSEKLLEMKAEALFLMRRYEDAIELCEKTLGSSERNSPPIDVHHQSANMDGSKLSKYFYFRVWRCRISLKSHFQLGRLEDGLTSLEKHEEKLSATYRNESKILESSLPLAVTIRELLCHKAAGNEAFQAGKHAEAVEHYTAALSCNVESRPFAAVCFCNRAAAFKALGQITDAIADCSLAMALDGNYLKAISRRATLYEMIRDYGQAAHDLERLTARIAKQLEEKSNQSGASDISHRSTNDLRQARLRLSEIEEESRKDIPLDMYLILGVDPSVSTSEIKKAYRKAALRHHPDKAGQFLARSDNSDDGLWKEIAEEVYKDADRLFKMIGEAYAVLSDPNTRARYDAEEEIRNALKKRNGSSTSRAQTETQNYPFDRSGGRRQWKDIWRSNGNSATTTWSEASRSNRYT